MKYASLRQGLVGAWCPSLGPSGNMLLDRSGYGNHGTLTNMDAGTDWVGSRFARALDFDGSDDRAALSSVVPIAAGAITVSGWIYRTGTSANNNGIIFAKGTLEGNANSTAALYWNESLGWSWFTVDAANTLYIARSNTLTSLREWIHVCGISSTAGLSLYLNGSLATSISSSPVKNSTHGSSLGGASTGAGFANLNGQLDDVRCYVRVLTPQEIRLLATEPGIGLKPERTSVFFGAQLFNAAWAKNSNQLISAGVI